jgi:hypothetical protein
MGEQIGICCIDSLEGEDKMHNVAFGFPQCVSGRGHCWGFQGFMKECNSWVATTLQGG